MNRPPMLRLATPMLGLAVLAALAPAAPPAPGLAADAPDAGTSYQVPYLLTQTNHTLVRVRIDGKGPFHFVVDTGAPALYMSSEAAKKAGLETRPDAFFATIKRLDFEGGAHLENVQARVEDIFQLVGMNALGLPGVRIDGVLGFNVLARFRIELDPTRDRMTWTRLAHEPDELIVPANRKDEAPAGVKALELLGTVAQGAALLLGKQPEDRRVPRGSIGVELEAADNADGKTVRIASVLPGSPASEAGLKPGDQIEKLAGKAIETVPQALGALASTKVGDRVEIVVRRGDEAESKPITITAGPGF